MDPEKFVSNRIKLARKAAGLSQAEMAKILGGAQASISDIERGRVHINIDDLFKLANILNKPINYFLPVNQKEKSEDELILLDIFRPLSNDWKQRVILKVKEQAELFNRMQPYIRAGIPQEYYEQLFAHEEEALKKSQLIYSNLIKEAGVRSEKRADDFNDWYKNATAKLNDSEE